MLEKANIKTKQQNKWFFDRESNQLRITDQPHAQSPIRLIEQNEKAPTGWKYKARNALMYFPEGKSESWVNDNDGRSKPKAIAHENTHVISTLEVTITLSIQDFNFSSSSLIDKENTQ